MQNQITEQQQGEAGEAVFQREERYIVLKLNRLSQDQLSQIRQTLEAARAGDALVDCAVVEDDWPISPVVWHLIERFWRQDTQQQQARHHWPPVVGQKVKALKIYEVTVKGFDGNTIICKHRDADGINDYKGYRIDQLEPLDEATPGPIEAAVFNTQLDSELTQTWQMADAVADEINASGALAWSSHMRGLIGLGRSLERQIVSSEQLLDHLIYTLNSVHAFAETVADVSGLTHSDAEGYVKEIEIALEQAKKHKNSH